MNTVQNQTINGVSLERVANAVRKLCTASSNNLGADCFVHAHLAASILLRLGVQARVVVGQSSWRVGAGSQDVISHMFQGFNGQVVGFHAWLEIDNLIFDPTLYQIPMKVQAMDAIDGYHTTVDWAPTYLVSERADVKTDKKVLSPNSPAGTFYYQEIPPLQELVQLRFERNQEDEENAWICYQNPDSMIFGPNSVAL